MPEEFEWSADNEDIVVPWQGAIAVYQNPIGAIVIRQEGHAGDDDPFVVVQPEYVERLIAKLREVSAQALTDNAIEKATK